MHSIHRPKWMTVSQKQSGAILCGIVSLAILLVELLLPLNWDNWVYQTMGWDLYAYGKLPYSGSWDVNFPGIVYLHAISIALLGTSDLAFRVFDVTIEVATSLLFYKLLTRWFRPSFALVASIIYPLLYVSLTWSVAGQRDAFAVFFLLAGLDLLFGAMEKPSSLATTVRFVAAGFLISACAIIRPTYGLWPLSVILAYVFAVRQFDRRLWSFILGTGLAVMALFLPYLLAANGIRDFYRFALQFNFDVYSKYEQSSSPLLSALQLTGRITAAYALGGLLTIGVMRQQKSNFPTRQIPRFVLLLYSLLIASSLTSVFVLRSFYPYHFLPLLALLAPLMACTVFAPLLLGKRRFVSVPLAAILMLYLIFRLYPRNLVHHYRDALSSSMPALEYMYKVNAVDSDSLTGREAEAQAVAYLKKADPGQLPIEVICYNRPYLRVKAGIESATRFTEILPLALRTRENTFTPYQVEWREEFVDRLREKRPIFIIFADNLTRGFVPQGPFDLAKAIPGFSDLLTRNYRCDTVIRGFTFYRLLEVVVNQDSNVLR